MVILLGGGGGPDDGLEQLGEHIHRGIMGYAQIKDQRKGREQADRQLGQADRQIDQRDKEREQRGEQFDKEFKAQEDWRDYRKKRDEIADAEKKQDDIATYRAITGREPPEEVIGPFQDGSRSGIDVTLDIPASIQQSINEHLQDPNVTPAESAKFKRDMKLAAISKKAGRLRRLVERTSMPDPEQQGPGAQTGEQSREQMVPYEQSKKWLEQISEEEKNPTGTLDLDELEDKINTHIDSESKRRAQYELADAAVGRIDNAIAKFNQRSLEDGVGGMDADQLEHVMVLRDKIAAHGATGAVLNSLENDALNLLYGRGGSSGSGSSKRGEPHLSPEDRMYDRDLQNAKDLGYEGAEAEAYINRAQAFRASMKRSAGPNGGKAKAKTLQEAIDAGEVDPTNKEETVAWLRANVTPEGAAQIAGMGQQEQAPERGGIPMSSEPELGPDLGPKRRAEGQPKGLGYGKSGKKGEAYSSASKGGEEDAPKAKFISKPVYRYPNAMGEGKSTGLMSGQEEPQAANVLEDMAEDVGKWQKFKENGGRSSSRPGRKDRTPDEEIEASTGDLETAIKEYEALYGKVPKKLEAKLKKLRTGK